MKKFAKITRIRKAATATQERAEEIAQHYHLSDSRYSFREYHKGGNDYVVAAYDGHGLVIGFVA